MQQGTQNKKGYFKADPDKRFYPGQLVKLYPNFWYFENTRSELRVSDAPDSPVGMLLSMKRTGNQYKSWQRNSTQTFQVLIRVLLDDKIVYTNTYDNTIDKTIFPLN